MNCRSLRHTCSECSTDDDSCPVCDLDVSAFRLYLDETLTVNEDEVIVCRCENCYTRYVHKMPKHTNLAEIGDQSELVERLPNQEEITV